MKYRIEYDEMIVLLVFANILSSRQNSWSLKIFIQVIIQNLMVW